MSEPKPSEHLYRIELRPGRRARITKPCGARFWMHPGAWRQVVQVSLPKGTKVESVK